MDEAIIGRTKKREPLAALVLSLIMPGLGHIYCGKIVKGLILVFLSCTLTPVLFILPSINQSAIRIAIIILTSFLSLVISLVAVIDSWYTSRHTSEGYVLKDYNKWYIYLILVLMGMGGSIPVHFYVKSNLFEAFRIPTTPNYPTFIPNDRFVANKLVYKNSDPKRGDLVVFISPQDRKVCWSKRVVAVAGDTVEIKDNELYINDQKLQRQKLPQTILDKIRIDVDGRPLVGEVFEEINNGARYKIFFSPHPRGDFAKITVPKEQCFILGDNRNLSFDSRDFGPIFVAMIKGRADFIYWPAKDWSRFGKIEN